jgi:hypothetical protein
VTSHLTLVNIATILSNALKSVAAVAAERGSRFAYTLLTRVTTVGFASWTRNALLRVVFIESVDAFAIIARLLVNAYRVLAACGRADFAFVYIDAARVMLHKTLLADTFRLFAVRVDYANLIGGATHVLTKFVNRVLDAAVLVHSITRLALTLISTRFIDTKGVPTASSRFQTLVDVFARLAIAHKARFAFTRVATNFVDTIGVWTARANLVLAFVDVQALFGDH